MSQQTVTRSDLTTSLSNVDSERSDTMPYDRPLGSTLAVMRRSGMPGRLKMLAQLAGNEIIRGMTVTFLSCMVLLMSQA